MQSYTFEELDIRGKVFAVSRYPASHLINDLAAGVDVSAPGFCLADSYVFQFIHWRFTEHGERVA